MVVKTRSGSTPNRRASRRRKTTVSVYAPPRPSVRKVSVVRWRPPSGGPVQRALRANAPLKKGVIVLKMNGDKLLFLTQAQFDKAIREEGKPMDHAVYVRDRYVTDWINRRPLWYNLNHAPASAANLYMSWKNETVVWIASKSIKEGDLLTFPYGEPDPAWLSI